MSIDFTKFKFYNSPYLIKEIDNWHLTEDAPIEIVEDFERFKKLLKIEEQ